MRSSLGELGGGGGGPARSGINLQKPGDSGISLEQGGSDEIDAGFLSLGHSPGSEKTPIPASDKSAESSSEF